jgi:ssDNA-binding Zn-finger/Zn-ribbon topoisomerase 1
MGGEDESKMDHRKRKRNRTIRSCVPCHNHKRKVRHLRRGGTWLTCSAIDRDHARGVPLWR